MYAYSSSMFPGIQLSRAMLSWIQQGARGYHFAAGPRMSAGECSVGVCDSVSTPKRLDAPGRYFTGVFYW
jgi:hypothetical protein